MPIVPRVSQAPLPGARVNPNAPQEAFGGGIASQRMPNLSGVANAAVGEMEQRQRIAQEAAAEADQVATTHAYSATVIGSNDMLHGPDGLLNRRGKDAFTIDQEAYDRYGEMVAKIREGLGTDRQRAIYDKMVLHQWDQIDSQVQPHIAAQRRVFDKEGTDAGIEANNAKALASYTNPAIVDDAIEHNQALTAGFLRRQGAPDEAIDSAKADVASQMRFNVLQAMLATGKDDLTANAYFAKYREQFVGKDLQHAEQLTKAGAQRAESQRQADQLIQGSATASDALKAAEAIQDPTIRDETVKRVQKHYTDIAAAQRHDREQAFATLGAKLEKNGGDVDRLTATREWLAVTPAERTSLERRAKVIRHPDEGPGDPEQYTTLINKAYFNPDEFASDDILSMSGLSAKQKERLMSLQRTVGNRVHREETRDLMGVIKEADKELKSGEREPTDTTNTAALGRDTTLDNALRGPRPTTSSSSVFSDVSGGSSSASTGRSAANPLGLEPVDLSPPTPQMLQDIQRKGPKYAEYLRLHGIDAPLVVEPPPEPAAPAPAKPKTVKIVRDSNGRATKLVQKE